MRKSLTNGGGPKPFRRSLLLAALGLFVGGELPFHPAANAQDSKSSPLSNAQILQSAISTSSVLGPGDVVDIQVFNTPELSGKQEISEGGLIRLPHTGSIQIGGMSPFQAGDEIERHLRESKVLNDPEVTVLVVEHATGQIAVLGEVNRPGTYTFQRAPTLTAVLAAAGGPTQREGSVISVTHRNGTTEQILRVTPDHPAGDHPDMLVEPFDVVLVSQVGFIYVVGDVNRPGEFSLSNGHAINALEAVALAQGLKQTAKPSKASIVRTDLNGNVQTIHVDLSVAARGVATSAVLEPQDVLVVPYSGYREFEFNFLPQLTGAAANAIALALVSH